MSKEQAEAFVAAVGRRQSIAQRLAKIEEGDWEAVVALGAQNEFVFTVEELKAAIPDDFYSEHPDSNPKVSWSRKTLE